MKQKPVRSSLFFLFLLLISPFAYADRNSDIEKIFDWAEAQYPQYFSPTPAVTQTIENYEGFSWRYRYYPNTNTYMGINNEDKAYTHGLGGGGLAYIELMSAVLNSIDNGNSSSAGNGNCVNVPLVASGRKVTMKATNTTTADVVSLNITYDEVTETQAKTTTTSTSSVPQGNSTSTTVQYYVINNNYFEISKIDTTIQTSAGNVVGETTFSPAKRVPAKMLCEGQTWSSSYTATTKTTVSGFPSETQGSISISGIVEAVNESKTAAAGTFNTVKVSEDSGNDKTVAWTAIDNGVLVYQETYDSAGNLIATTELTALE